MTITGFLDGSVLLDLSLLRLSLGLLLCLNCLICVFSLLNFICSRCVSFWFETKVLGVFMLWWAALGVLFLGLLVLLFWVLIADTGVVLIWVVGFSDLLGY